MEDGIARRKNERKRCRVTVPQKRNERKKSRENNGNCGKQGGKK